MSAELTIPQDRRRSRVGWTIEADYLAAHRVD
jgi:hypothetical protein